ncbi:MAG: amylo-alpha-1,6-glucosidase, partial [Chloroflexota bacterium]
YNAVRTVAAIARSRDSALADRLDGIADRIYESFNRRFRSPDLDYLADFVDGPAGDDWTMRPNQIFAISLPEPLLADESARRVLEAVGRSLYTSYGLRSLAPSDPAYRGDYVGDRVQRDGGYHQGPVWCWLIGPYIEAHLKINRRPEQALEFLRPLRDHLFDAGLGSISEIMEGHAPHRPRGCIAQAWSVAEAYRVWRLLLGELHRERSTCM